VFDLSPHISADYYGTFAHQTTLGGKTESNMWYTLQMIVNAGNRNGNTEHPVDWNYLPDLIESLTLNTIGGPSHPYRGAETWAKIIQSFYRGPLTLTMNEAFSRQAHPAHWGGMAFVTDLEPHARADVFNTMLAAYMDAVESYDVTAWTRPPNPDTPGRWEDATYVPVPVVGQWRQAHDANRYADLWFTMIPEFRRWGVDQELLNRLILWGAQMWPLGDWASLVGPPAYIGYGDGLTGTYFRDVNLSEADFQRVDPFLRFRWPDGESPGGGLSHNNFTVRWEGYILPLFGGPATFYVKMDDGARLWVDDRLIVDRWSTGGQVVTEQGTLTLPEGELVPIRIEYIERQGNAEIELSWSSPWHPRVVVPQTQFYTTPSLRRSAVAQGETTDAPVTDASALVTELTLAPGRPNPFASTTTLAYALPAPGAARLEVYDLLGRRVAVLADGEHEAGFHTATFDARLLASGTYVCRLQAGGEVRTQKVLVVR
jgi:hypothetical protein